ncbi:hypothetical protein [Aeromonas veronii]|uniref:hypothetical protein n=1 Tax=Aeromonas veronii TaxID=654 RepID=UPI003D1F85FE
MKQKPIARGVRRAIRSTRRPLNARGAGADYLHGVEHFWLNNLEAPIEVVAASVVGLVSYSDDADPETYPIDQPVLVNTDALVAKAGSGPLRDALDDIYRQLPALVVVVRVDKTAAKADALAAGSDPFVGGVDENGKKTGLQALLDAETVLGLCPRILMIQGDHGEDYPAHAPALETVALKLHAIPVVSREGAPTAVVKWAETLDEVYVVHGQCIVGHDESKQPIYHDVQATVVGHIMRVDNAEGYWNSPSNRKIYGILGMKTPIDSGRGGTSTANYLNGQGVACIVQRNGGFYLWGNRLKNMVMLPHQRIRYIVGVSIMDAHDDFVDRNIKKNYVEGVKNRVNMLIRRLHLREVVSGGECWVDKEVNIAMIGTGQVQWDYSLGLYDVAERLTFRQHIDTSFNESIFE